MNSMNPWSTPPGHASEGRGKLHCPTLPQDKMVFGQDFLATGVGCLWKAWFQHNECTNLHGSVPKMSASSPLQGKVCTTVYSLACAVFLAQNNFSEAIPSFNHVCTWFSQGATTSREVKHGNAVCLGRQASRPLGLSYENLGWDLKLYFFRKE